MNSLNKSKQCRRGYNFVNILLRPPLFLAFSESSLDVRNCSVGHPCLFIERRCSSEHLLTHTDIRRYE